MLSTDPGALEQGSDTQKRMEEYAEALGELHIVALARRGSVGIRKPNLFLYPASSRWSILRLFHAWQIGRILCYRMRFDVVSAQSPDEVGLIGFLLARRFGIPLQLQVHTDVMSLWYRKASWKEWIRWRIAQFLIPRAACVRVVSQRVAKGLFQIKSEMRDRLSPERLGQKPTVLPIFTDISKYASASTDPETERRFKAYDFKMIAVGRFVDKEKNFSLLIEMMRDFVKICPTALLVLVGEGPDAKRYKLQATLGRRRQPGKVNYKLDKNITIEPWRSDLPSFYKCFDLFLLSSNYEGWGRAVVEAMVAGLGVVMTDVGLAGEVVEDGKNGLVVPVGDRAAFLAAVTNLYQNPQTRRQLTQAGQLTARELRPKTKDEYLRLYKQSFVACIVP